MAPTAKKLKRTNKKSRLQQEHKQRQQVTRTLTYEEENSRQVLIASYTQNDQPPLELEYTGPWDPEWLYLPLQDEGLLDTLGLDGKNKGIKVKAGERVYLRAEGTSEPVNGSSLAARSPHTPALSSPNLRTRLTMERAAVRSQDQAALLSRNVKGKGRAIPPSALPLLPTPPAPFRNPSSSLPSTNPCYVSKWLDDSFLNSLSPLPISPLSSQDASQTVANQAQAQAIPRKIKPILRPRLRVPQPFPSLSPLHNEPQLSHMQQSVIDLCTPSPKILPISGPGRDADDTISIDSDTDPGGFDARDDDVPNGQPLHLDTDPGDFNAGDGDGDVSNSQLLQQPKPRLPTFPSFHFNLGSDFGLPHDNSNSAPLTPSPLATGRFTMPGSLDSLHHSDYLPSPRCASVSPIVSTGSKSWPYDWHVVNVLACFTHCSWLPPGQTVKQAFETFVPGLEFSRTFWKYRKHWQSASSETQNKFLKYSHTADGLWTHFMEEVPNSKGEHRNATKQETRAQKRTASQME
ncbi:uncharacterized protein PHACADRAFT_199704 [Phanerochaete carnosa HHB-10118-sp]|uniref:Uncharacterized protein n=1 Tax=Phanerochaete carnosa (strain HHB-10118-sp) TaxID=650164 RepID=K5VVP3_PHACS|nr:uncharacterized protein PHACADRAFT_199704 [Phanerochaete carnosa HHB-10118-sp]EKM50855.1 hypothetical protein PHACADRAFT_199704 [Phanerochaete carnosa HHB-10118-sp]